MIASEDASKGARGFSDLDEKGVRGWREDPVVRAREMAKDLIRTKRLPRGWGRDRRSWMRTPREPLRVPSATPSRGREGLRGVAGEADDATLRNNSQKHPCRAHTDRDRLHSSRGRYLTDASLNDPATGMRCNGLIVRNHKNQ